MEAFKIHANGYLRKPIQKDELLRELHYILQMPVFGDEQKPYIRTFGNFDVFVHNRPVAFRRRKSKEILAYLTDREGGWVTNRELVVVLWDAFGCDPARSKYVTTLVNDMLTDLDEAAIGYIVERKRGRLRLVKEEVQCDYYEYLSNRMPTDHRVHVEYMSQYSWGEKTLALMLGRKTEL